MAKVKITVLKREFYPDLANMYVGRETEACTRFADGQEFMVETLDQPANFCAAAWQDISANVNVLLKGGNFTPWMKEEDINILCCTDGIRPVVFEVKRV